MKETLVSLPCLTVRYLGAGQGQRMAPWGTAKPGSAAWLSQAIKTPGVFTFLWHSSSMTRTPTPHVVKASVPLPTISQGYYRELACSLVRDISRSLLASQSPLFQISCFHCTLELLHVLLPRSPPFSPLFSPILALIPTFSPKHHQQEVVVCSSISSNGEVTRTTGTTNLTM